MHRKQPIVHGALEPLALLCCALACGPGAAPAADPRPNIVIILADDLGANDLSSCGRRDHSTPRLDRLAAEGMRFTSACCAQPICSPSRAALLTGKHPARLHLTNFLPGRADAPSQMLRQPVIEGQLPLEEVTLAEILRSAGYATACIGKWHLGGEGFGPKEQGFDHAYPGRAATEPTRTEGSKGEYDLTREAERWLEENRARPFFLYLAYNSPHIPFGATPEDAARNKDAFHPAYAAVVEHLDACAGRIAAKLDALGLAGRTVLIFTSDNGGLHVLESPGTPATHNTPFRAGKGYVYEGGLRVPLIVRWPGRVRPGVVSDAPVVLTDLMPTLLEAAGLEPAKAAGPLDGASLLRLLEGGELAPRALFWHFPHYTNQGGRPAGAVRDGRWKLVESYEEGRAELYDLARDPSEARDLAREEPGRAAELRSKLAAWRRQVGAQECTPNPELDERLHARLYVERDPSRIAGAATAREVALAWAEWRKAMDEAVKGRKPAVTPARGDIRLRARDARVHGQTLRYEPEPWKDTLGYWVKVEDWASWEVDVAKAGRYEVEVLQGCGEGSGGAEVSVEVAGRSLAFTVEETGHFQRFAQRAIGAVHLPAGKAAVAVKPRTKPGPAVMDLRRLVLRPVE